MEAQELVVDATDEGFVTVQGFVEELLERLEIPMKLQIAINISFEEMFINIVHYAYPEGVGKASVRVELLENPRRIVLTLKDSGIPYNPLAKEDPDITASVENRLIGGLGIFMTKKYMDEVNYSHVDGMNVFSMAKYL